MHLNLERASSVMEAYFSQTFIHYLCQMAVYRPSWWRVREKKQTKKSLPAVYFVNIMVKLNTFQNLIDFKLLLE